MSAESEEERIILYTSSSLRYTYNPHAATLNLDYKLHVWQDLELIYKRINGKQFINLSINEIYILTFTI